MYFTEGYYFLLKYEVGTVITFNCGVKKNIRWNFKILKISFLSKIRTAPNSLQKTCNKYLTAF